MMSPLMVSQETLFFLHSLFTILVLMINVLCVMSKCMDADHVSDVSYTFSSFWPLMMLQMLLSCLILMLLLTLVSYSSATFWFHHHYYYPWFYGWPGYGWGYGRR